MSRACLALQIMDSELAAIPPEFVCPITHALMTDPVVAADGNSYERLAIEAWFRRGRPSSPLTNELLPHTSLIPNNSLKKVIRDLQARQVLDTRKKRQHAHEALEEHRTPSLSSSVFLVLLSMWDRICLGMLHFIMRSRSDIWLEGDIWMSLKEDLVTVVKAPLRRLQAVKLLGVLHCLLSPWCLAFCFALLRDFLCSFAEPLYASLGLVLVFLLLCTFVRACRGGFRGEKRLRGSRGSFARASTDRAKRHTD